MKKLVVYFSASGVTKRIAERIATITGSDIYEIVPEIPYTEADLNWMDKNSRSSKEMEDKTSRPAIKGHIDNIDEYDMIYLGFPIWWYVAPTIINTFIESYDLSNKTIRLFATSGSSGITNAINNLRTTYSNLNILDGKRFANEDEVETWVLNNNH